MNLYQLGDEALVAHFRQDSAEEANPKLLAELVRRFQEEIIKECYRYVKDREEAQDVSQEVWIRVITKLPQYDSAQRFRPWLFTIVKNRCLDHLRQNKKLLHQEISLKIVDSLQEEMEAEDSIRPTIELLEELMEKISGQGKLVLLLKHYRGWSNKEIQVSLTLSESTVKMRLARSCEKIRQLFDTYQREQSL